MTRLTLPPLTLELKKDDFDLARLEQVYVGVLMLTRFFPDVLKVSEKVLRLFKTLPLDFGIRRLELFVSSFSDVQYGKVWSRNIPDHLLDQIPASVDLESWRSSKDGKAVDIERLA